MSGGGTVRYHRAEFDPGEDTWRVWFRPTGGYYSFSGAEGEAMGLTPPEPEPLTPLDVISTIGVKFGNGRPVDYLLDRDDAEMVLDALAEAGYEVVLRDARQDPQPASGEPGTTDDDDHYEAWKADMAKWKADRDERDSWKETARQYAENADYWRDRLNDHKASLAIQAFTAPDEDEAVMMESLVARIADLQRHAARPLASDR